MNAVRRTRIAFVDESLSDATRDPHTYLLGAAVCEESAVAATGASVARLQLKGQVKVHWHDEDAKRRMLITETIAAAPVRHLVVVREGGSTERPERQRRKCLEHLLYELQALHVETVTFESRGPADDHRDRATVDGLRARAWSVVTCASSMFGARVKQCSGCPTRSVVRSCSTAWEIWPTWKHSGQEPTCGSSP